MYNIYIFRLRNLNATCPNCRIDLSRATASRNLAVEKIVSELQSECQVRPYLLLYLIELNSVIVKLIFYNFSQFFFLLIIFKIKI